MKHEATIAQLARLVLRPSQWDAHAADAARRLPTDAPGVNVAWLAEECLSGRSRVSVIERDGERLGYVVFCLTAAHELVIQAAIGWGGENLTAELVPLVDSLARQCECQTVRFHTMRPGLIVKAQRHGFRVSEVIMRKAVR